MTSTLIDTEKNHPVIRYDADLINSIVRDLDLRKPNHGALEAVARHFENMTGTPFTGVCALATGVGKTHVAAAIISYLARHEVRVRNFLIVVPNDVIYNKTVANFTDNNPKSLLAGMRMDSATLVVTPDNFMEISATDLCDDTITKIYVFIINSLIAPTRDMKRRVHNIKGDLGMSLYDHLAALNDLVVLSDEHHRYSETAMRFNTTIAELEFMANIGLTATPACNVDDNGNAHKHVPNCRILYTYPLGAAIADKFVKIPCLIGRTDDDDSDDVKLLDGLIVLNNKQHAADAYSETYKMKRIKPIMLVVCKSIHEANTTADKIRGLEGFKNESILVVTEESTTEDNESLVMVEDLDNPVRVIVAVIKLNEGWDVKNVYVICPLRASLSNTLTEQTLGRGLRLPWGIHTGEDFLDTVAVIAHGSYQRLIALAGSVFAGVELPVELMGDQGQRTCAAINNIKKGTVEARQQLTLPQVDIIPSTQRLNLNRLEEEQFKSLGYNCTIHSQTEIQQTVTDFNVGADNDLLYNPRTIDSRLAASYAPAVAGEVQIQLFNYICNLDSFPQNNGSAKKRARVFAGKVVEGAGSEDKVLANMETICIKIKTLFNKLFHDLLLHQDIMATVTMVTPDLTRTMRTSEAVDIRVAFIDKRAPYSGWSEERSLHAFVQFDTPAERSAAICIDGDYDVDKWMRIEARKNILAIPRTGGGYYYPDFYVRTVNGHQYLVEIKGDGFMDSEDTTSKMEDAAQWTRVVQDELHENWSYLLISEHMIKGAQSFAQLRQRAQAAAQN